ncbi:MAG TPA: ankyrin repeat domain-containing protein [Methylophilaceae bacterium]
MDSHSAATVQLMLDHHVNVKAKDQYGLTALVYAMKKQQHDIVKLLKDAGGSY